MPSFSERIGLVEPNAVIQLNAISDSLKNSLWNVIVQRIEASTAKHWSDFARRVAADFLKVPVDELPYNWWENRDWVKKRVMNLPWHRQYDFIEFVVLNATDALGGRKAPILAHFNQVLEREGSGYRFIGELLSPIASPAEIEAISQAVSATSRTGFEGAREHLNAALSLLGKRPEPDYRNSIKESISAVESVVKVVSGRTGGGVADALEELSKRQPVHGALKSGLKSLYGYTSDESGIRHALLDAPTVGFDEAKFMLVSCAAFVNYLIAKAGAAGIA